MTILSSRWIRTQDLSVSSGMLWTTMYRLRMDNFCKNNKEQIIDKKLIKNYYSQKDINKIEKKKNRTMRFGSESFDVFKHCICIQRWKTFCKSGAIFDNIKIQASQSHSICNLKIVFKEE